MRIPNAENTKAEDDFGRVWRQARIDAGYTQQLAANSMGMSQGNYCTFENKGRARVWLNVWRGIVAMRLPLERFFPNDLILEAAKRITRAENARKQRESISQEKTAR